MEEDVFADHGNVSCCHSDNSSTQNVALVANAKLYSNSTSYITCGNKGHLVVNMVGKEKETSGIQMSLNVEGD